MKIENLEKAVKAKEQIASIKFDIKSLETALEYSNKEPDKNSYITFKTEWTNREEFVVPTIVTNTAIQMTITEYRDRLRRIEKEIETL